MKKFRPTQKWAQAQMIQISLIHKPGEHARDVDIAVQPQILNTPGNQEFAYTLWWNPSYGIAQAV